MLAFLSIMLMGILLTEPTQMPLFETPPIIDGSVGSNEWDNAYVFPDEFTEVRPDFGKKWDEKTVVRAGYDKDNFYVLFEVHQDTASLVERKGTRDAEMDQDAVAVFLDPLGNKNEYYFISFGLSGAIMDLRMMRATLGESEDITWNADVYSEVKKSDFGYIVEAKIPFYNFRRKAGKENLWHINLWRRMESQNREAMCMPLRALERDAWYEDVVPIVFKGIGAREKIRITPYGIYGSTLDTAYTEQGAAGFDMKVPVGATGVANFAFNPDFSQLEGDPLQFTFNIQYALYYPEYRPFFIEERSVFETDLDIFYSRKIQNPLIAGRYTYKGAENQVGALFAYDEAEQVQNMGRVSQKPF